MEFGDSRIPSNFWEKCEKQDGCWIWVGCRQPNGYGKHGERGRTWLAHRRAYSAAYGEPAGPLDHLCRRRACCNPNHLEEVTNAENLRRGYRTRLTPSDIETIRNSAASQADLARQFAVCPSHISKIKSKAKWNL